MSYDYFLKAPECEHCNQTWYKEGSNYTANLYKVYHQVLPNPIHGGGKYDGEGESEPRTGLPGLSGLLAKDIISILEKAIVDIDNEWDKLTKLAPPNGWGDLAGGKQYLQEILDNCRSAPHNAIFYLNW